MDFWAFLTILTVIGSKTLQTITFDNLSTNNNLVATNNGTYLLTAADATVEFELVAATAALTHVRITRDNIARNSQPMDCIELDIPHMHWYGGPEDRHQYWPIERATYTNFSYLTKEDHNVGLAERYWLNSNGVFFFVEDVTPLFIEQNSPGHENQLCLSALSTLPYDSRVERVSFTYHIAVAKDAKAAHMYAVKNFLGLPSDYPDERMVQHPIWSTWALYKAEIDENVVRSFANAIVSNGFNNSQLEIDDDWEDCYGALTFRKAKFPNIKQLTDDLKAQGFRVTLWIHPFINKNCTAIYNEALSKGYLVLDHNGNPDTQWWNSKTGEAAYIDFTKPEVQQWFAARLKRLQTEDGIDSFKFDAGESSWLPDDPVLQGSLDFHPSQITRDYVRTVGAFGPLVEVRSGQGTQDMPIFVRMLDKDSEWNWNNGLVTLITTLLQMNMNGYPFVLPDMIGGNGYNEKPPSKELFLRWLQANVFMPSLQFSFVPWNYDAETIEISKKFTTLHSEYTSQIMERFKLAVETGAPVNPPLWWIDPTDEVAQGIYDHYFRYVAGLSVTDINVPDIVDFRDNVTLACGYDMRGHTLNSVKWYKGEKEFFRYSPMMHPVYMKFPVTGVQVQEGKHFCNESTCRVELSLLGAESSGIYRCEVSGDAPHFKLATRKANMTVAALPQNDPLIESFNSMYRLDEFVSATCSSDFSSLPTKLTWYINGEQALLGELQPSIDNSIPAHDYILRRQKLQVHFYLNGVRYYYNGGRSLELKCVAEIEKFPELKRETTLSAQLIHQDNLNNQMLVHAGHGNGSASNAVSCLLLVILSQLTLCWSLL